MIKRIIYFSTFIILCLSLAGCTSNKESNYKKTDYGIFDIYNLYVLQSRDEFDPVMCARCLESFGIGESFCKTQETININGENLDLSNILNNKLLTEEQVKCLIDNKVVKHYRFPYILYKIGETFFNIFK